MHAVGQAEVVILLQCLPDEKTVPKDIFTHFVQLYQEALSGKNTTTSSSRTLAMKLVHFHTGIWYLVSTVSGFPGESTCVWQVLSSKIIR